MSGKSASRVEMPETAVRDRHERGAIQARVAAGARMGKSWIAVALWSEHYGVVLPKPSANSIMVGPVQTQTFYRSVLDLCL